jgi:[protein-PII] uridylyltransferase
VVHAFAKRVGDLLYLDHIYLLTVADIRGTNPKLWNSWRDSLLRELYEATRRAMRHGLESPVDREDRIEEARLQATSLLQRKGITRQRIESAWEEYSGDYFLRHSPEEIAWHTRAVLKKADDDRALVLARAEPSGTQIFVYKRNCDTLFATTTAVLDQMGLTVVDARILTAASGFTLDTYTVLEADGEPIIVRARTRAIVTRLRQELNRREGPPLEPTRRTSRRLRHFSTPTTVSFVGQDALGRNALELITADRPGMLSRVGSVFRDLGVRIHNARIATLGERAEDVFFVTDADNLPFNDRAQRERIREALVAELDGERAGAAAVFSGSATT